MLKINGINAFLLTGGFLFKKRFEAFYAAFNERSLPGSTGCASLTWGSLKNLFSWMQQEKLKTKKQTIRPERWYRNAIRPWTLPKFSAVSAERQYHMSRHVLRWVYSKTHLAWTSISWNEKMRTEALIHQSTHPTLHWIQKSHLVQHILKWFARLHLNLNVYFGELRINKSQAKKHLPEWPMIMDIINMEAFYCRSRERLQTFSSIHLQKAQNMTSFGSKPSACEVAPVNCFRIGKNPHPSDSSCFSEK